jgi:hypothetical protein
MRKVIGGIVASALVLAVIGTAVAAVTFDSETGTGFVGKGDVQLKYGWNNKQLQDNAASVSFRYNAEVVEEVSWTCTKDGETNSQQRQRTTTNSTAGVLSHIARERNQITGFVLSGYAGNPTVVVGATEGPALNSCPSGWSVTTPPGTPEVVSSTGGLEVSTGGDFEVIN